MNTLTMSSGTTARLIQRGLRLPQLRLMIAIEETGQISAAATQMGMTQPAASRLLGELEKTSGAKLYERHARGVILTEAGRLLARRARATLQDLNGAFDEIALLTTGARGLVRIGTVTGPGLEIVLPIIREIRVTYPEIEFNVLVDTSDKLAEALLSHDLDFYLGRLPAALDPRAVTLRRIGTEPISLAVRQGHPLLRRAPISLADCLAYDWVMQPPGGLMRLTAETYLLERGLPPPARVLSTSSLLLTLGLISDTNAIAPIATSVAELYTSASRLGSNIRILDVAQDIQVAAYSLICGRESEPSPAVRRVMAQLEQRLDQLEEDAG
ncbi:LysR family transcriptional regulator [Puniceibacterium sediminis]|uniref:DNA-binding transcriptional regulator, LysR family n=1 Tax=Puniceibacterium sediminis TaxID=1608407 RepID=A0A238XEV9_9RHOB|nr:LysR family transcriptional regulator [Puniceibacterium sediminis]SNR57546.1 DNA-binding transcriptional regulator, LysR family [Puniceibacterium sediminis]